MLRAAGLSDRGILDAVLTIAYFSFANRLVMGLGLALEPGFEATCRPDLDPARDLGALRRRLLPYPSALV